MGSWIRQPSFAGGEISPLFYGRTDLPLWSRAARGLSNFFIGPSGASISRPGTRFIAKAKLQNQPIRLIPFHYSSTVSYVVELGVGYARFYTDGARVEVAGVPVEVATPYAAGDLFDIQFAQVGDVMTLTHPSRAPMELRRTSATAFTLTDLSFTPPNTLFLSAPTVSTSAPMVVNDGLVFTPDATHPARDWRWYSTATVRNLRTNELRETLPQLVQHSFSGSTVDDGSVVLLGALQPVVVGPDRKVSIRRVGWSLDAPSAGGYADYKVERYNFFRGMGDPFAGGKFGLVGVASGTDFVDPGDEPDYLSPPPTGQSPFPTTLAQLALVGFVDRPISTTFFDNRRWFGGSSYRPTRLFGSADGDYFNFDQPVAVVPGEAIIVDAAAVQREAIRTMVPALERLLVFTDASIWSFRSIDETTRQFLRSEEEGSNSMRPLCVDGAVLYVGARSRSVRAVVASDADRLSTVDVSEHAEHLFVDETRTLKDWCFQKLPFGLVWAVRGDGDFLSLTFSRRRETAAWARHRTEGTVGSICSVPESKEDAVYMAVLRSSANPAFDGYWRVERMNSRKVRRVPEDVSSVDCAEVVNFLVGPIGDVAGLERFEGQEVWFTAAGNAPLGPVVVAGGVAPFAALGRECVANNSGTCVGYVGQAFGATMELLDVIGAEARAKQKTVVNVGFEVDNSRGLKVGQDEEHLVEWRSNTVAAGYVSPELASELVTMPIDGKWDEYARAVLVQDLPLPVTVLALAREVEVGGR